MFDKLYSDKCSDPSTLSCNSIVNNNFAVFHILVNRCIFQYKSIKETSVSSISTD